MGVFRSEPGRAAYMAAYQAMQAKWQVPTGSRYVPTGLGLTHVLETGRREAPPLVLLPAGSLSATEWFANAAGLAAHHHVFAVDIVGDAGKSVLERAPQNAEDYAEWLAELFAGLDLVRPAVAGHCYGGWLTLALAIHRPQAVGPIVVLAPSSGLASFHWYMRAFLAVAEKLPFRPGARRSLQMQAHKGFVVDDTFVRLMQTMTANARTEMLFAGPFSDAELRRIGARTLVLAGEREMLYSPRAAIARARRLIPNVTAELVPGCSQLLNMERPQAVNGAILAFLRNGIPQTQATVIPMRRARRTR